MAREMGISPGNSAALLSLLALTDTVARLVVPVLSEKIKHKVSRIQIYAVNYLVKAVACLGKDAVLFPFIIVFVTEEDMLDVIKKINHTHCYGYPTD